MEEKSILFILGGGFDPRMCFCLNLLVKENDHAKLDCFLIGLDEAERSSPPDLQSRVAKNDSELQHIMKGRGTIRRKSIRMEDDDGHSVGPRNITRIFDDCDFDEYTDIVVDISSLPLSIYFPLIGKILNILESCKRNHIINLHVMVTENIEIDRCIKKYGLADDATYLYGFTGNLDLESEAKSPLVWIPVLGEDQSSQMGLTKDLVQPNEICPILPFPSVDPRRGDKILLESRDLIDSLLIESRNIIYATEQNPFQVYRQINKTTEYYRDALEPLGNARFAISPLSSKLMSMGVFLVAYEEWISNKKKVGITHVESRGYTMINYHESLLPYCEPFSMWIFGDCYGSDRELG